MHKMQRQQGTTVKMRRTENTDQQSGECHQIGRKTFLRQHNRMEYVSKPEVSPDFLQCLNTLTKRDFEHASSEPEPKKEMRHNNNVNNNVNYSGRPLTRKPGLDGFNFFAQSSLSSAQSFSRPITVPRFHLQSEKDDNFQLGKDIMRPISAASTVPKPRSAKPKASPVKFGALFQDHNGNIGRPITVVGSDCSVNSTSDSERPSSACSGKRVTFAADVVNYERENKPSKKRKMPKRRKQGFPHPSRGIFIPPDLEIVESSGPAGPCRNNPYLNFNQVWTHPSARTTGESTKSQLIRQDRFHRLMNDLEHAHIHYNRLTNLKQNDYLTQNIFKRYILVLDLALTEGHLNQVEHLLETISKSVPVLHQNTFFYMYGSKIIKDNDAEPVEKPAEVMSETHPDLMLAKYALSRISGELPRHDCSQMSIETVLAKLCLELIEVVFSQFGSLVYRNALNTLPYTVKQAIALLREIKTSKDTYTYIKWINNSAVQRDFRSILKSLGLLDKYGSKGEFPGSMLSLHTTGNPDSKIQKPPIIESAYFGKPKSSSSPLNKD